MSGSPDGVGKNGYGVAFLDENKVAHQQGESAVVADDSLQNILVDSLEGGGGDPLEGASLDVVGNGEDSPLTVVSSKTLQEIRSALEYTEYFLQEILAGMEGAGIRGRQEGLSTLEDRVLVARIAAMAERTRTMAIGVLPELPFRLAEQVVPSPAAYDFILKAKEKAELEKKEKDELVANTVKTLSTIFSFKIDVTKADVVGRIEAFAAKYASKDGLDVNMVISSFSDSDSVFYLGADKYVIESVFKDPGAEDLVSDPKVSIFRSGVLPSKHFEQLLHGKVAALVMNLSKAWQSRCAEGGKDEFLVGLMIKAKRYIEATFSAGFLGPELSTCTSLAEVQLYANFLPVDEHSFDILKKAHLLLKVMHIVLLHESEVNEVSYVANSVNLREDIGDFGMSLPNGRCYLNPPRDKDGKPKADFEVDNYGIEVDRVEVAEVKPLDSTIDKILRRDLYDTTEIGDFARMRIFLKKEDCYDDNGDFNKAKAEKAMEKVLGVIISRFGNSIDVDSLDYSLDTGKTNEASGGAHRGLHFNFKYKSSSNKNGLTEEEGDPITKAISVEGQILVYTAADEYNEDHDRYRESRRALLFKKLGFENGFDNFVMDLISAVSNDKYDFGFRSMTDPFADIKDVDGEIRKVYERQCGFGDEDLFPEDVDMESLMKEGWILFSKDRLRLFILLLTILTKRGGDGELVNGRFIEYMQRYFPGKLHKLLNKYARKLKGDEFKEGGDKAYLKRTMDAKMSFVRGIISTAKPLTVGREATRLFEVSHSFKVENVGRGAVKGKGKGKKKPPQLTLLTSLGMDGSRQGHIMKLPYTGPIGLTEERPRDGEKGKVIDFCWQLQDGNKSEPVYSIEHDEKEKVVNCYLLAGGQKLPMWVLQLDYVDESGLNGKIYPCVYGIEKDPRTNRASIGACPIANGRNISVRNLKKLSPSMGMDRRQARFLNLVKEAGKIWDQAKEHKISAGEYPILV